MAHVSPSSTSWGPERKIVAAAVATLVMAILGAIFPDVDVPVGVEGAIAVVVGYFMPNKKLDA